MSTRLDEEMLAQLRAIGGDEFLAELLDVYVGDAATRFEGLRAAAAAGDTERLAAEAHALKSSSGNIGAATVRDLCAVLEKQAREGRLKDVSGKLTGLDRAYEEALVALRKASGSTG